MGSSYFNLKAGNAKTILTSELYKARLRHQRHRIRKEDAPLEDRYERKTDKSGHPRSTSKPPTTDHRQQRELQLRVRPRPGYRVREDNAPTLLSTTRLLKYI